MNTTMQDLALTPKKSTEGESNWCFSKLPMREEMDVSSAPPSAQQNNERKTPKRIGRFVLDSSPLFVTPEPERREAMVERGVVIDLTDD